VTGITRSNTSLVAGPIPDRDRFGIIQTVAQTFNGAFAVSTSTLGGFQKWTLNVANTAAIFPTGVLGYNHVLKFGGLATVGDWALTITATGTGSNQPGTMTVGVAHGFVGDLIVDLTNLVHVGNLNGIQSFRFAATAVNAIHVDGDGNLGSALTMNYMAAVPEPASLALLGLTAIGGFFVNRRRKRAIVD
jgi:hypothetical protein